MSDSKPLPNDVKKLETLDPNSEEWALAANSIIEAAMIDAGYLPQRTASDNVAPPEPNEPT